MILVIDNYDSFVHNLARYLRQLGCETVIVRNDQTDADSIQAIAPQAIVISPGPCTPDEAGGCLEIVKQLGPHLPILGICLGHQVIVQAMGGTIQLANEPIHGRQSPVFHSDSPLFENIPSPFMAGRYHSLVASRTELPAEFDVAAHTEDGTVMGVIHRSLPLFGLQFHPESILTEWGYQLLFNFLKLAGINVSDLNLPENHPISELGHACRPPSKPTTSNRLTIQERP